MILPVYAYGNSVLKKKGAVIDAHYEHLHQLIDDMWETMNHAQGVGLAAPQIGLSIRLFVVDTTKFHDEESDEPIAELGFKKVFINAEKIAEGGERWAYEEGCLSIPDIRGDVERPAQIRLKYLDEHFMPHEEIFTGMNARVIQHEYDHIDGILFLDHLKPLKRRLIQRKLENIKKGKVDISYKMKFLEPKR
ncbi:MAG: peptide deformylase [Saprospiraceae bacterium]|nr:peptide deformylase [Saprospiraceae bacterium]